MIALDTAGSPTPAGRIAVRALDIDRASRDLVLQASPAGQSYTTLAAFVRRGSQPLGWISVPVAAAGTVHAAQLERAFAEQLDACGPPTPRNIARGGLSDEEPLVSVVVPTCAQPTAVLRCVRGIRDHASGSLEIIVVENRPLGSEVAAALTAAFGEVSGVRYVEEPRPGLSHARNAGLAAAAGGIVAFVDDDVLVDEFWLASVREAFAANPAASCVTGLILPIELGTRAQVLLEQFASFGKGLAQRVYTADERPPDVPLFPYTAGHFGSGANMAFRRERLRSLGGFDTALGAGTSARGGEDLDIFIRLIVGGLTLVYEPRAVVWHRHPDTMHLLHRQAFSYGVGLGALITKHLTQGPDRLECVGRIRTGLRYLFSRTSRKNAGKDRDFPWRLVVLERLGLALGPIAYARSRRHARDMTRQGENAEVMPAAVCRVWSGELELTNPVIEGGARLTASGLEFDEARLLIRVLGEPIGFVQTPLSSGLLDHAQALNVVSRDLGDMVDRELQLNEAASVADLVAGPSFGVAKQPSVTDSDRTLVTVIVCTRNRADVLPPCLESLQRLRHRNLELLIVDNAPDDSATMDLVLKLASEDDRIRYVREGRPGLSVARNRGLREASGDFIAYTDDDVRVDPLWIDGLLRGFGRRADIGCVTGLVASASLERPAEQYFDARVSWSSSCEQRLYEAAASPGNSKLHPYAAGVFGTGANVAFRKSVLEAIGGFDESLGAGSPTAGGEDLDAFVRVLRRGSALTYEPAALVWHDHRADEAELLKQMYCYGKGLSAYLCKFLFSSSSRRDVAYRLLIGALHAARLARRSRAAADQASVAPGLLKAEMRGVLAGPWTYFKARSRQTRQHVRAVSP